MVVVEFRICMPMSMEEYQRGSLYALAKASQLNTTASEGFETLENREFHDPDAKDPRLECGTYTRKILHLGPRVPKLVRLLTPKNALLLEEESWNCFPYIKTVYHSSYFGARFQLEVESMIVDDDRGEHPNALNLSPEVLAVRKIDYIDIVADENQEGGYDAKENPGKFKSKATNRGPLSANFYKDCTPVMCVYKVVTCKCEFGPFQNKAETVCLSAGMRDLLLPFHRQIFCWIDDWFNMTMEQIKAFEHEVQTKLNALPFKKEQSAKLADNASVEVVEKDQQMLSRASLAKEGKDETGNNNNNNNNDSGRKSPAKK